MLFFWTFYQSIVKVSVASCLFPFHVDSQSFTILTIFCLSRFELYVLLLETAFSSMVDGKNEEMSTSELTGGTRIHYIFQSIFVKSLEVLVASFSKLWSSIVWVPISAFSWNNQYEIIRFVLNHSVFFHFWFVWLDELLAPTVTDIFTWKT